MLRVESLVQVHCCAQKHHQGKRMGQASTEMTDLTTKTPICSEPNLHNTAVYVSQVYALTADDP